MKQAATKAEKIGKASKKLEKVLKAAEKDAKVVKEPKKKAVAVAQDAPKADKPAKKAKKEAAEPVTETEEKIDLPTTESHPELKELVEKTQEVEAEEQKAEAVESTEEQVEVPEKVKVKRKDTLVKSKDKKDKAGNFLSLETPAEDNKSIKVSGKPLARRSGVVYISHIPHGFYEKQMQAFFKQFGSVKNLRIGRSKKTGASRGFAFVEFTYAAVAKIVADTMNNYLMFNKLMKCELIPQERVSHKIFAGKINPLKPPGLMARRAAKKLQNSSTLTQEKRTEKVEKKLRKFNKQMETAGIKYSVEVS